MPKTTAIQLTKRNIDLISDVLGVREERIEEDYIDYVLRPLGAEPVYYVTNPVLISSRVPYLVYGRSTFLDEFASVPPGIEDRFVPVTQVKA